MSGGEKVTVSAIFVPIPTQYISKSHHEGSELALRVHPKSSSFFSAISSYVGLHTVGY